MSVGLVGRSGTGLVLLDVVLCQEDPVLQVGQGGAEVLGLVSLPLLVQPVTLRYTVRHLHTEMGNIRTTQLSTFQNYKISVLSKTLISRIYPGFEASR